MHGADVHGADLHGLGLCIEQMCMGWLGLEQEMCMDWGEWVEGLGGASCPDFNTASRGPFPNTSPVGGQGKVGDSWPSAHKLQQSGTEGCS